MKGTINAWAAVLLLILVGFGILSIRGLGVSRAYSASQSAQQSEALPDVLLRVEGNTPLAVQEARAKEITAADFARLTGGQSSSSRLVSWPQVTLVNNSGRTITEFAVALRRNGEDKIRGVLLSDKSLKPGQTFTVNRDRFIFPEKITKQGPDGKYRPEFAKHALTSEKMWMPCAATDVSVVVRYIKYEDGEVWTVGTTQ